MVCFLLSKLCFHTSELIKQIISVWVIKYFNNSSKGSFGYYCFHFLFTLSVLCLFFKSSVFLQLVFKPFSDIVVQSNYTSLHFLFRILQQIYHTHIKCYTSPCTFSSTVSPKPLIYYYSYNESMSILTKTRVPSLEAMG